MASNFVLQLKSALLQVPKVTYDNGSIFSALTNFDEIPITIKILQSSTDETEVQASDTGVNVTQMLVWGYKGEVKRTFTGDGTTTDYELETDKSQYVSFSKVTIDGTTSTIGSSVDTTGTNAVLKFDSAPAADAIIVVYYVRKEVTSDLAEWETYSESKTIAFDKDLVSETGSATVSVELRDDVYNESIVATATATVDITVPSVTIVKTYYETDYTTVPSLKISKVTGRDKVKADFQVSESCLEWELVIVQDADDAHDADSNIHITSTTGGSVVSGTKTTDDPFIKDTDYTAILSGKDLPTTVADGDLIIKIFAKDLSGNWSE